jgi:hypothetical protein
VGSKKYVAKTASGDMIYIPVFKKIGIDIQKFIGRVYTRRHTHTQQNDLVRLGSFLFKVREAG